MIVGNGDIASVLPDRDDLNFFASGVSNSGEKRGSEYARERELLLRQDRAAHIVYFGTLAVFYSDTPYTRHKLSQEATIKDEFDTWTIMRIGNITFGDNPHTLINYLRAHPDAEIRDEVRYIVGEYEFLHWVNLIPPWSAEMNLTGRMMTVKEIKEEYCEE